MSKNKDTSKFVSRDVHELANQANELTVDELNTVVGGHKSGPTNYNKKNVTIPFPQTSTN